jgi:hypothetical protein
MERGLQRKQKLTQNPKQQENPISQGDAGKSMWKRKKKRKI